MRAADDCPNCGAVGSYTLGPDPWEYGHCRICSSCGCYQPEAVGFPWLAAAITLALIASLVAAVVQ